MEHLADAFDSVGHVGCDKDTYGVRVVAQNVVGASSYEHTRILFGRLADGVALKFEKRFVTELVGVWVAIAENGSKRAEQYFEKAFVFIITFEELFVETAFFCSQVQKFLIIKLDVEIFRNAVPDDASAAT